LTTLQKDPPALFVIDLARLPGQGRDVGLYLRQRKATREVPIVFVGGDPAKVARFQTLLPDAVFTSWSRIRGALSRALKSRPPRGVVRDSLAGYAGTPLPRKLGIKASSTLTLLGAPESFARTLGPLPEGVRVRRQARGHAEVVILFVKSRADLRRRLPVAKRALADRGRLWIAWPKKAANVRTDLSQQVVREIGLSHSLVDYKIAALDATWSGLAFARRGGK
jgi:hypothetical protein